MRKLLKWSLVGLLALAWGTAGAEVVPQSAYDSVRESTDNLLERLIKVQPFYDSEPDRFFDEVNAALGPYIDFEGFAKRVMAKHYRKASVEQRRIFVDKFRHSLIKTYATALIEFDNEKVVVLKPSAPQKKPDRATIKIEIHAKSGTIFTVHYQLDLVDSPERDLVNSPERTNQNRWLLRNVIINGINIGLQFRSQFNAYMQKYHGDIDLVIENWSLDENS